MDSERFESLLDDLCGRLTAEIRRGRAFSKSIDFENRVRAIVSRLVGAESGVDLTPNPQAFPDIVLGEFGIEVKFTTNDSWRSVANSVFESTRDKDVRHIYVVFGKMGGVPEVSWGRYGECVIHVRTSHMPRFEVQVMSREEKERGVTPRESWFRKMGVSYDQFYRLPLEERMKHVRKYARSRLKEGEHLWWLEDSPDEAHPLDLEVRLYMYLPQEEKRRLRAEAAILCPQIVKPTRSKKKYDAAAMYLITYHGVLCPQARDLFTAGSVALRSDARRGGNYMLRALKDIEAEMREAAIRLEDGLFEEYWGRRVPPRSRIREWLDRADAYAVTWRPSDFLFR